MIEVLKYELKAPFAIAASGETEEAIFLEISSPTNEVVSHLCTLDSEFSKAMVNISNSIKVDRSSMPEKNESDKIEAKDITMMLAGSGGNIEKCALALKKILCKTCLINGDKKFNDVHFMKMHYKDTKDLLGEYLGFFFSSSLGN